MKTQDVLAGLRRESGLTQDEMAARVFVTRQAVSRWETGVTTPNAQTLKLISKEFNVSIDALLGQGAICQSCAMPLASFDDVGTENDGGASTDYCHYCYQSGDFTHHHSMEEMVELNLRYLDQWNTGQGTSFTIDEAREILTAHLATLKRWQSTEKP